MHFLSFDEAWRIGKDRRQWILDAAEESRMLKRRRRPRSTARSGTDSLAGDDRRREGGPVVLRPRWPQSGPGAA
jgi:hypothetical protein